jgi:hypothetical protein
VGYSSFDGASFTVSYSVTCSSGGVSVTVNVVFRITRV